MFSWLRRKKEEPPKKRFSSLFSTEITKEQLEQFDWKDVLGQSFQKEPASNPVDRYGKPANVTSAFPGGRDLGIGQYAMDSPTEGNPLSMKPLLEPIQNIPYAQLCWYAAQGFVGYQICAMLGQHWLIDKACTIPARDAMRHGFEIASEDNEEIDPKVLSFIKKRDKHFGIKQNCVEFVRFNRMFGIRIALPVIEGVDNAFYELPFDVSKVKPGSYKGISQIDPYWITPELDFSSSANPASIHFYEPTWWRINGRRVHRTHLVIIRNGQVADILKPSYIYGGIPVPQKISERVYAAERTANEAPQLALTKRTTIMKMDITQAIANFSKFQAVMDFFARNRDNYGVKTVGLDDEVEQFDVALGDFDATIMTQYQIVAAASDVPYTKLMADSPKGGIGSDGGDYNNGSYHEFLETLQMNDMEPLIDRHHLLLMVSEVVPKFGSKVPKDWQPVVSWNSTDTLSAKEQAEVNEIKSRTGNNLTNSGAIDGVDERERLAQDKDSGYNGMADRVPEMPGDEDDDGGNDQSGDKGKVKSDPEPKGESDAD